LYFGYAQIWRFTFVPVGFLIVMSAFVALALVYAVGASNGARAAAKYVNVTMMIFLGAVVLDVLVASLTGQLPRFVRTLGWTPLLEMTVLAAMCVGSMWFMAVSYVTSKLNEGA